MKFHPYSEIFPLLEGATLDELVADIKAHGLRERIWLYEGQILDGRNRFLACQKAKVKPKYRTLKGTEQAALAFVVSANIHRRQLTDAQRAMAAARIATLRKGANQNSPKNTGESDTGASRDAPSQSDAAQQMDVSRSSVQRARKVIEKGSKALQQAVDKGEVPLKRAAAVTDLPKSEQLQAATAPMQAKPDADEPPRDDDWTENEEVAAIDRELSESIEKVMCADDKLAAAHTEIKRQAAEIAVLKLSRDGYMNGKQAVTRMLKSEQRKREKLTQQLEKAEAEIEKLRERVSIMEAA